VGTLDTRKGWLMAVVALGTSSGCLLNDWTQIYLVFLPLLVIVASFGLFRITESLWQKWSVAGRSFVAACVLLSSGYLFAGAYAETPLSEAAGLKAQKSLTEYIVNQTRASDSIGVFWNECAGYMFNDTLQYFWVMFPPWEGFLEKSTGENSFGDAFIDALDQKQTKFIIGADGDSLEGLPMQSRAYVTENFSYKDCLWTRNE
jgi:hypothetical protein